MMAPPLLNLTTLPDTFNPKTMYKTEQKEEWCKRRILLLIDSFKNYECLWNPNHPHYENTNKKNSAWANLASEVGSNIRSVEKKIRNLKRQFMHCYKHAKRSKNGHDQPRWFAYNYLMFLSPEALTIKGEERTHSRQGEQVYSLTSIESERSMSEEAINRSRRPSSEKKYVSINTHHCEHYPEYDRNQFRDRDHYSSYRNPYLPSVSIPSNPKVSIKDEFSIFGEHVAYRLRNIGDKKSRLTAQCQINTILFDVEMQEQEKNTLETDASFYKEEGNAIRLGNNPGKYSINKKK